MSIKEQIAAWSDLGEVRCDIREVNDNVDHYIRVPDLKALADSHTRLLAAAKAVEDDMQGANTQLDTRVEFGRAIEEAEKL